MIALDCQFGSRAALREALLEDFPDGGVFVAGGYEVTAGTPVLLCVAAEGLGAPVFVEGLVQWRRTAPRAGDVAAARAGLGVRLLGSQRDRFQFLSRWCDGRLETSGRRDTRYPFDHPMQMALNPNTRRTGRIVLARLREVGEHGAQVSTPVPLSVSSVVSAAVTWEGKLLEVSARVSWSTDDRAGLRIVANGAEHDAHWSRLYEGARQSFARRVASSPRSPSTPALPSVR